MSPATDDPEARTDASRARDARILFFSGGTALRPLSLVLKRATRESIHVVTPFDSGGSSGPLRAAFGMPAIGDLRNRLVALAADDAPGSRESGALVSHRLDPRAPADALRARLDALVVGDDPLVCDAPAPLRAFACEELARFREEMPADFDLRGANVGNLILTGAWLRKRDLRAALESLAKLLSVRGTVLPTVDASLHLAVRLEDGSRIVGQHRFTGKEHGPLASPIRSVELVDTLDDGGGATRVAAPAAVLDAIRSADLICFPMGSFFSSVVCNLLPAGVGRAVADAPCAKVYVPSTGRDPETLGIDASRATALLLETLRRDAGDDVPTGRLLDAVLLWRDGAFDAVPPERDAIAAVERARPAARSRDDGGEIDPERLAETLLAAAARSQ